MDEINSRMMTQEEVMRLVLHYTASSNRINCTEIVRQISHPLPLNKVFNFHMNYDKPTRREKQVSKAEHRSVTNLMLTCDPTNHLQMTLTSEKAYILHTES